MLTSEILDPMKFIAVLMCVLSAMLLGVPVAGYRSRARVGEGARASLGVTGQGRKGHRRQWAMGNGQWQTLAKDRHKQ